MQITRERMREKRILGLCMCIMCREGGEREREKHTLREREFKELTLAGIARFSFHSETSRLSRSLCLSEPYIYTNQQKTNQTEIQLSTQKSCKRRF